LNPEANVECGGSYPTYEEWKLFLIVLSYEPE